MTESFQFFPKFQVNIDAGIGFKDFWKSTEGIGKRIEMLTQNVVAASFNNTLEVTAKNYNIKQFIMSGPSPICPYCIQYYGQTFTVDQFLPSMPAHPGCFHGWDIVSPTYGEKPL